MLIIKQSHFNYGFIFKALIKGLKDAERHVPLFFMLKSMVFGIVNSKSINNFELSSVFTVDLQFNIKRQSTCMRLIRYIFFCLALILWVACGSD